MTLTFALLAGLVLGGAFAAVTCRNRVHAGLFLAACLVGLALVFLRLGAEFLGFIQILVYVGAVAVLIVFAILLTRDAESPRDRLANAPASGILIALALFALLAWAISTGKFPAAPAETAAVAPALSVKALGDRLFREYVLPLQAVGLLLTAALIGAAVIALPAPKPDPLDDSDASGPAS